VTPQPLTPEFLSARVPELEDPALAEAVIEVLKAAGHVSRTNGMLLKPPHWVVRPDWRDALMESDIPGRHLQNLDQEVMMAKVLFVTFSHW
jgi:hypothetical protein